MRRFRLLFVAVSAALLIPAALLSRRALQSVEIEQSAPDQTEIAIDIADANAKQEAREGIVYGADPDAVPNNLITERAPLQDFTIWYDE